MLASSFHLAKVGASVGGGVVGALLQYSDAGGADGYDAAALGPSAVQRIGGTGVQRVTLGVDVVRRRVFSLHRAEGVQPHMQRDKGDLDTGVADARQQFRREVQPGVGAAALPGWLA